MRRGSLVGKIFDRFLDLCAAIAVVLLFTIMISVGLDVIARTAFASSLTWTLEFSEYGLLAILFLAMPWLVREQGHVAIEILTDRLPEAQRAVSYRAGAAVSGFVSAYLGWWAGILASRDYAVGVETIGIYPIPRFLLALLVCFGLVLTAVAFAREAVRGPAAGASNRPEDKPSL